MNEWNKQDFPNTLILTRYRFGLFCINMCKFIKELWPLINVRISYQLNILRVNKGNFDKILHMHILKILTSYGLVLLCIIWCKYGN